MSHTENWIYVDQTTEIFRKYEFYDLKWNIHNCVVKVASFGGPIALTRDLNKPDIRALISIYSQSGYIIKTFQLEEKSMIIGIGWTSSEDLMIILESGEIQLRSIYGQPKNVLNVIKDSRAVDFRIFNTLNTYTGSYTTGCVILSAKNKLILIKDVYDPKIQQFPDIPGSSELDSWCVISNEKNCSILASKQNDIYQIAYAGVPQLLKPNFGVEFNCIKKICVSFNNDHVALNTDTGYILVWNSEMNRIIHKYKAESTETALDIAWVSNKAILALWDNLYLIPLGSQDTKNHFEIYYSPPCYLVQELDGIRVLTSSSNMFLQVVPKALKDIFEIASFDVSSALFESSIAFYESKNQKAEEYIRSIKKKGALEDAIANCIQAAPHEFEPKYQVEILRAALFGRYFDDYANAASYVKMCQTIRVLNAIRHPQIGIPLTYLQYEALSPSVVINRLITRRHFALAIEICKYLNMTDEEGIIKILSNWALYKVSQTDVEDNQIAAMIKSKLGDTPGISYAEIARRAISAGRSGLAIRLLDYEVKASEQVPLYIEIDMHELAIKKAMESGDTDLIYMVLFWYQNKFNNMSDFMKDISKKYPIAFYLMLQYLRKKSIDEENFNELNDILNQENLITEQVCTTIAVALKQERPDQKTQMLDEAKRLYANKEVFNTSLLNDEIKLIKIQMNLDRNYRKNFDGKSLYETLSELIRLKLLDESEKIRKEFKISDSSESWWHLKAKSLAKGSCWEELEKFSKTKKSPIGYEPFVNYCMEANNVNEAKKYFPKVAPDSRFNCLIKMKCLADALDLAYQKKDLQQVNIVIGKCDSSTQKILIDKAKMYRAELINK